MIDLLFTAKLKREGPCRVWTGNIGHNGYGLLSRWVNGKARGYRAHRYAWMLAHGEIPDGMQVLHTCDNRRCCEITHLWLGTNADNRADQIAKGRSGRGARCGKLTAEDRAEIIKIRALGATAVDMARHYGVTRETILKIVHGQTWQKGTAPNCHWS